MRRWLTRLRVPLGFGLATVVLWLADPLWPTWTLGLLVAACGEAVRVWAAGHLEKSREVTRSGPYRYIRHPLYSSLLLLTWGIFFKRPMWAGALLALAATGFLIWTARADEAECRVVFGEEYDRYLRTTRRFIPFIL